MTALNIYQTKDAILKWVESCTTDEHIDLLTDVVTEFIVERFSGKYEPQYPKVNTLEVEVIVDDILHELAERKVIIKRIYFQSLNKVTP